MQNRTHAYIKKTTFLIAVLGLIASFYLGNTQSDTNEIPFVFLYENGLSLYFQSAVYIIVFTQVLRFRMVRNFIEIRNKTEMILIKLVRLIVLEWGIFWASVLVPYCVLHFLTLFKLGNPIIGIILLLMHMILMLILMLIIVLAYQMPYPYLIVIFSIFVMQLYHYGLEIPVLLPKYSMIFDPMYRAIHHIYF